MLVILLCFNALFTSGIVNGTGTTSPHTALLLQPMATIFCFEIIGLS